MKKTDRFVKAIRFGTAAVFGAAAIAVFCADILAPPREWAPLNIASFSVSTSEQASSAPAISAETFPININTASVEELRVLPLIGKFAENIVAYRESYGMFGEISEIINISGIEAEMLEQIGDMIIV